MPSMTYCMFENTEGELSQCVEAMEQAENIDELDMSDYERASFNRMWRLCRTFLADHERLLNAE